MCGRFGLFARLDAIEDRYGRDVVADYTPRYNIAPEGSDVLTVPNDSKAIESMQWGIRPDWVDDPADWPHPINARAETIAEKPSFREAFRKRRCLIPANGFFEWTGRQGARIPYWISFDDELVSMAGIWETWGEDGDELQSIAIITTDSNDIVDELHDRMPVILDHEEEERWLREDDPDELGELLDPYPSGRTSSSEVSKSVNNPASEGPELIEPVSGQSGLGDFD